MARVNSASPIARDDSDALELTLTFVDELDFVEDEDELEELTYLRATVRELHVGLELLEKASTSLAVASVEYIHSPSPRSCGESIEMIAPDAAESSSSYVNEWAMVEDDDVLQGLFLAWDDNEASNELVPGGRSRSTPSSDDLIAEPISSECAAATATSAWATSSSSLNQDIGDKPRFTSSSARQKHTMKMLQSEAQRLSETLQRLKETTACATVSRGQKKLFPNHELLTTSKWKAVADQQRKHVQHLQSERRQLKLHVLDYKKLVKDLKRALSKRIATHKHLNKALQLSPVCVVGADVSPKDRAIFHELTASLTVMHKNIANVYWTLQTQIPAAASSRGSFRKWDVHVDASMSVFVGVVNCEEVPFEKVQVESAMRLLHDQEQPGRRNYSAEEFGGSSDMMLFQRSFRYPGPIETDNYQICAASQLFVDGDHSGSLWVATIDTIDALGNEALGFMLKAQTWTVLIEQHDAQQTASTLVQTYTSITPVAFRGKCSFRWEKEILEALLIPEWDRSISAGHQRLENALLDQVAQN